MATVPNSTEFSSAVSSDALELLDCFHSGLEDIVYEIAEDLAKKRKGTPEKAPIQIEATDVVTAGNMVLDAIKHLAESGQISNEVVSAVEEMRQRCKSR